MNLRLTDLNWQIASNTFLQIDAFSLPAYIFSNMTSQSVAVEVFFTHTTTCLVDPSELARMGLISLNFPRCLVAIMKPNS